MIRLEGDTSGAESFLAEWETPSDVIVARTSGSTGTPKEIMLPKSDMRVSASATNRFFGITEESTLLMPLSADYIAGKMMVVRACLAGCRLIVEPPSPRPVKKDYGRIDLLPLVPAQIEGFLASPAASPEDISGIIIGGAPLSAPLEKRLMECGFRAWASYGMTETCSHVALRQLGDECFTALDSVTFSVDERSCLVIESMPGTYSWKTLRTNDVVTLESPRRFIWRGRADNVINTGGVKIFPEQEERRLAGRLKGEYYITSFSHPKWGEAVGLVLEGEYSCEEMKEVERICEECLSRYARPKRTVCVDRFERTSSGKVKRRNDMF